MSQEIQRPALGQSAELGSLYDSRSDSFLPLSLLSCAAPIAAIVSNDKVEWEIKLSFGDSYEEKFYNLNVTPELAASFLSGIVDVDGSAKYLLDNRRSHRILQASIHHSMTTREERLDLATLEANSLLTLNEMKGSSPTHVVVGIIWGAQTIVTARQQIGSNDKRANIRSDFQAKLESFKSIVESGGETELANLGQQRLKGIPSEVVVYSDLLTDDDIGPDDLQSALKFIRDVPRYIALENAGKGKPLAFALLPLGTLVYLTQEAVELKAALSVSQLRVDSIEGFVRLFDELHDAQRKLHDYDSEIESHRFCVPPEHRHLVAKHLSKIKDLEARTKSKYTYLLSAVQSGREDNQSFSQLLELCNKALSSERLIGVTEAYQPKMNFADMIIGKGAKYIGYGASSDSLERALRNKDVDIYVLFFDEDSRLNQSLWVANQHLLTQVLDNLSCKKSVLVFDCEAKGTKVKGSCIKHYHNGKIIDEDVLETSRINAGKCFARYETRSFGGSGTEKPLRRSPVKIPCPGRHCTENPELHDWICFKCHAIIEYSLLDHNIYCDCGRNSYRKYDFRCGSARHGPIFEEYDPKRLLELLKSLEPFPELNILILGETGVGKSTFINAFINYLSFETLDDAMKDEKLNSVIPCSFAMQYVDKDDPNGKFIEKDIKVGFSTTEHDGVAGQSATQKTAVYPMMLEDTIVRLIDTPGIGDTRGVDQDRENMANVLSTISNFGELHGVLILLKPNNSRLNLMFRFCVKELLTHLHRDAARNMVFGFTNTRISNYTPGDTFRPLGALLNEHKDVGISLSRNTVYCYDSESFRFLAAQKNGVDMENVDDFRRSWQRSWEESTRMLDYFRNLSPHLVKSTLSMNRTRELIAQLTKPMAHIAQTIETTIRINEDAVQELTEKRLKGDELRNRLTFQKVILELKKLDRPRTVCSHRSCVEYKDNGNGQTETIYKSPCHFDCHLSGITVKVIGPPQLAGCSAFGGGRTQNCMNCGHHWMQHLHVRYELLEKTVTVKDDAIERQLEMNATDISLKETAIAHISDQIAEAKKEHKQIQDAAVKFGIFLKRNSITPYNDAMLELLDHQIREEKDKVSFQRSNRRNNKLVDRQKLDALMRRRKEYAQRIDAISRSMASKRKTEVLDEDGVDRLVQSLYDLKGWGKNLKDVKMGAQLADMAAYRERAYCVPQTRNPASRTKEAEVPAPQMIDLTAEAVAVGPERTEIDENLARKTFRWAKIGVSAITTHLSSFQAPTVSQ